MNTKSQTREMGRMWRAADVLPASINEDARTVEVVWTTGARVKRRSWFDGSWFEELSLDPKHVRMERLQSGRAPVLLQHNSWDPDAHQGVVVSAKLEKSQGTAVLRFLTGDVDADKTWNKIRQGVLTTVSVGYDVHKMEKIEDGDETIPVYRATDWEPYEISPVSLPADPDAVIRSADDKKSRTHACEIITRGEPPQKEQRNMPNENNGSGAVESVRAAERERVTTIQGFIRKHNLDDKLGAKLVADGTSVDEARKVILDALATRADEVGISSHLRVGDREYVLRGSRGTGQQDALPEHVRDMADGLALRLGWRSTNASSAARQFERLSVVDLARECIYSRGERVRFLAPRQILERAFAGGTTSDFSLLLSSAGDRLLMQGYETAQSGIKQIARQSSSRDFRKKKLIRLSEAPELKKVNEHGEVTNGAMTEDSRDSYPVETFARIFSLTRQAMINDDLAAFDVVAAYGRAGAEFEHTELAKLLTSNPLMPDGKTLFHTDHGNLAATGSAISITSLGAAAAAMRTQKSWDGRMVLNITPRYLLVPAALEVVARQHVAQINANQATHVNPFGGQLEVVVDPRLDAASKLSWYLAAAPGAGPGLEYSYLDGQTGPVIEQVEDARILGVSWRVILDWGCGVVSHEGLYKNPGA
ncbi:prohead protease/major capsid protein fusion protein [Myxococcus fulvus]|uniref:prohead protease/major capsid protein fusion protein n=1 Tax=Myxococcus fulvus TaxID=33 RepID=UPI0020BED052|nr:prohead protease/major capsid protein fusion protein [Myxococcus fulvus]MCK8501743.1 Mu-like prophage major head subunit gpT family protein [Myxococcus fulvus]